ncbi:MAG: hypothetical protein ACREBG_16065 [Pyrinomonadaceae bacterium]
MNLLDENIPKSQRQLLEAWRERIYQIGFNVGRQGMQDDEMIPLLLKLHRPTFFTRDEDFYDRRLCHAKYSLAYLTVQKYEAAAFVRRLLRHPEFNTQVKRMGTVIRVSQAGLACWRLHIENQLRFRWP